MRRRQKNRTEKAHDKGGRVALQLPRTRFLEAERLSKEHKDCRTAHGHRRIEKTDVKAIFERYASIFPASQVIFQGT